MTTEQIITEIKAVYHKQGFLSRKETAAYLRVSASTLDRWANKGVGIPYTKRGSVKGKRGGRVVYAIRDIAEFVINARINTADFFSAQ
jgi:predicted site-specific integrase-resolvase